jgi:hypothetical protein
MEVSVIDNFFPVDLINKITIESDNYTWAFNRGDGNEDIYWTKEIYGYNLSKTESRSRFLDQFTEPTIKEAWEFIKNKYKMTDQNLLSVYLNGLTNGIEAHQHIDSNDPNSVTVICYLCDNWNSHWSGATSFYTGHFSNNPADAVFYTNDIEKTVLPRYNRVVFFNSKIIHGVHPISKTFKGLRKTLMFKLKGISHEELILYAA